MKRLILLSLILAGFALADVALPCHDIIVGGGTTYADSAKKYVPTTKDSFHPLRADGVAARALGYYDEHDFSQMASGYFRSWRVLGVASGSPTNAGGDANHPGVGNIASSATANSGVYCMTHSSAFILAGGEVCNALVRFGDLDSTTTFFGWHDALAQTRPTDGCYIDVTTTTARGFTSSNSTQDSTASTYTVATGKWYGMRVELNAAANNVRFTIIDSVGAQLWKDSLATNIPTGAGRYVGQGLVTTRSGTAAKYMTDIDWMDFFVPRALPGRPTR